MIKSMRAKNFKSWEDTGDIQLAPITGFWGTNSSGKTSLLQMLLLLKQSATPAESTEVLFWGDENSLVNLGAFEEVVFRHDIEQSLEMSLTYNFSDAAMENAFGKEPVTFTTSIRFESTLQPARPIMDHFSYRIGQYLMGIRYLGWNNHPNVYELQGDRLQIESNLHTLGLLDWIRLLRFYNFPNRVKVAFDNREYVLNPSTQLRSQLDSISYLGPLHEYPRRTYQWTGSNPSDIGKRGEHIVSTLLSSPSENGHRFVEQKVAEWLKKLGLIHSFSLRPVGQNQNDYKVVVKKTASSPEVMITDIGFGVSQILPILVLCYYVPEGSTIILEQPEIHLHPSVQADLADVFLDVVKTRNVQIIFESHSEYLLHRLQRRIAEEQLSADDTALYFCSMGENASHIEALQLDDYGNIANWPKDFFGDSTGDLVAMTEAAMKRKIAEQA